MSKKEKAVSSGLSFARSKYSFLIGSEKERKSGYNDIKSQLSFPELCNAIDYLEKNLKDRFKEVIFGNPLPKSYDDLGAYEEYPYLGDGIIAETSWILLSVRKYTYEINLFIAYKSLFEKNLLIGNFSEAGKYLDKIENEVCFSLWTLENRFLIKELSNASGNSKEFLSQFNLKSKAKGVTKSLAHFLSLRAEKTLSVNRYNSDLELSINKMQQKNRPELIEYYRFKLTFLSNLNFKHYKETELYTI